MHPAFPSQPRTTPSHLVHVWLLLVWLLSSHAFGPLLIMAVAGVTGDHTLKQCSSHHGEMSVVLGHSAPISSLLKEWLNPDLDAAQPAELDKPDHFFRLRSVEEASVHSRRIMPSGPTVVLLTARWVLSDFRPCSAFTTRIMPSRQQGCVWTDGLHVKASRTIVRC